MGPPLKVAQTRLGMAAFQTTSTKKASNAKNNVYYKNNYAIIISCFSDAVYLIKKWLQKNAI
jgi:hypothetical protein